ncbi:hypothetical protein Hanom_Chr06g00546051 [Helianthus anomalus]
MLFDQQFRTRRFFLLNKQLRMFCFLVMLLMILIHLERMCYEGTYSPMKKNLLHLY